MFTTAHRYANYRGVAMTPAIGHMARPTEWAHGSPSASEQYVVFAGRHQQRRRAGQLDLEFRCGVCVHAALEDAVRVAQVAGPTERRGTDPGEGLVPGDTGIRID